MNDYTFVITVSDMIGATVLVLFILLGGLWLLFNKLQELWQRFKKWRKK